MSNDDSTIVCKEGYLQTKLHGQPKWHRRYCIIDWDKSILFVASKTDRQYGDWIKLLPNISIIDSELPADYTIEIKADNQTHSLLPESKSEHDCWLIALKRTAFSRFGGGIFGQSLEDTYKYSLDKTSLVPVIVRQCCEFLREHGTNFVGLFRIPGKQSSIKELRDKYDRGQPIEFTSADSPATISSLLKIYLQSLPEPIIPMKHFDDFLELGTRFKQNHKSDLDHLKRMIESTLSNVNYALLAYLCLFVKKLTEYAAETKMDTENFAIAFGTNLIRPPEELDMSMIKGHNCNLFPLIKVMFDHSEYLFTTNLSECDEQFNESCEHQNETVTKSSGFSSFSSLLSNNDHQTIMRPRSSSLPSIPYATSRLNEQVNFNYRNRPVEKSSVQYRSKSVIEKPTDDVSCQSSSHLSTTTYIEEERANSEDQLDNVEKRLTNSERADREETIDEQINSRQLKRRSAIPWQFSSKSSTSTSLPRKPSKKTLADKVGKSFSSIKISMSKAFIPQISSMENISGTSNTLDPVLLRTTPRSDGQRMIDFKIPTDSLKQLQNEICKLKGIVEEKDSIINNLNKKCEDDHRRYEKENYKLREQIQQLQYENSQLKAIYQPDN